MDDETAHADATAKQRDEANKKRAEEVKKKLAEDREARSKATKDVSAVKPTPTQEENDLAASGVHVTEHEDDGSGPDPNVLQDKQSEANKPAAKGSYQTRTAAPTRHE